MYEWTAKSGVQVVSCLPRTNESVVRALFSEYARWYKRFRGQGK